jgi:hypothetical protein
MRVCMYEWCVAMEISTVREGGNEMRGNGNEIIKCS